jgi:gliding motility-associated lipoprotein GldH
MNFFLRTAILKIGGVFLIISFLLIGCRELDVYEKNTPIPNMQWSNDYNVKGTFLIKDTTSTYNVFLVLRHTDAYSYNNIWLNIGLQSPADTGLQYQKINLPLGNDAEGWSGVGMNDIWEIRKLISGTPKRFAKTGVYNFSIAQIMRDNPLKNLISIGMRLEKVK